MFCLFFAQESFIIFYANISSVFQNQEVYVKWRGCFMYPEVIKKMAFSKEHRDLLLKLYNKEITRREYDRLVQSLYKPSKEVCGG
ncbi:adhesin [Escherichia coli]|nr:adhesin [Escherichia coli]